MLYFFLKYTLTPLAKTFWLKEIKGSENLPEEGPYLLAVNHQSSLDSLIVSSAIPVGLYYLACEKFYRLAFFHYFMDKMEQIYVDRRAKDKASVYAETSYHLGNGRVVVIFPEGGRTHTGHIEKAFLGVARLALQNKVNIVPAAITGTFELHPPGSTWPKIGRTVKFEILPVIKYEEIKHLSEEEITHGIVMPRIASAIGEEYIYA